MAKIRAVLVTALLAAFAVWAVWQVIQPLIPYLVASLCLVMVIGLIYARLTRW
jgi:hypothetical protein